MAAAYMKDMDDEPKLKQHNRKIAWPVTRPAVGPLMGPVSAGETDGPDIDLERVIYDPEYRKRVLRHLNQDQSVN